MSDSKPATETIKKQQQAILQSLPFSDKQDFDNVKKGFVDRPNPNVLTQPIQVSGASPSSILLMACSKSPTAYIKYEA